MSRAPREPGGTTGRAIGLLLVAGLALGVFGIRQAAFGALEVAILPLAAGICFIIFGGVWFVLAGSFCRLGHPRWRNVLVSS